MEGRFGDEDARRFELRQIVEGELDRRRREFTDQLEEWLELTGGGIQHWGVWHPKYGWTWAYGIVFSTTHRAIAEAQRDVSVHMELTDSDLWEVRCIEEWADEQSG